jgi:LacI family transcriptional regulator
VAIGPREAAPDHDVITNDDSTAIRDAALHLVDNRYEHFILVTRRSDSNRDHHITVARDQLRALGVEPDSIDTTYSEHDVVAAFEAITPWLRRAPLPVAVITGSDASATGVLWACLRAGLRVPADVGILGYGGAPDTAVAAPPLSTFAPEVPAIRDIAELMATRIQRPGLPGRHVVIPWGFVARRSTAGGAAD